MEYEEIKIPTEEIEELLQGIVQKAVNKFIKEN